MEKEGEDGLVAEVIQKDNFGTPMEEKQKGCTGATRVFAEFQTRESPRT